MWTRGSGARSRIPVSDRYHGNSSSSISSARTGFTSSARRFRSAAARASEGSTRAELPPGHASAPRPPPFGPLSRPRLPGAGREGLPQLVPDGGRHLAQYRIGEPALETLPAGSDSGLPVSADLGEGLETFSRLISEEFVRPTVVIFRPEVAEHAFPDEIGPRLLPGSSGSRPPPRSAPAPRHLLAAQRLTKRPRRPSGASQEVGIPPVSGAGPCRGFPIRTMTGGQSDAARKQRHRTGRGRAGRHGRHRRKT